MNVWDILAISPTVNTIEIKRAYAKKLKLFHPEEDAEGFQRLREAYDQALQEAKYLKDLDIHHEPVSLPTEAENKPPVLITPSTNLQQLEEQNKLQSDQAIPPTEAAELFMTQVDVLYQDITRRKDVEHWKRLLEHEHFWRLDAKELIQDRMLHYIADHYYFPRQVWRLLDEHFAWTDQELSLSKSYSDEYINFLLQRIYQPWELRYNDLNGDLDIDYDFFLEKREAAAHALMQGQLEYAEQLLSEASHVYNQDSDLLRIIGIYYMRTEQYDPAYQAFQYLIEVNPAEIDGYLYRAGLRMKTGNIAAAFHDYQVVLTHHPDDLQGLSGLAACYIAFHQLLEAKSIYESIIELYPHDVDARVRLIELNDRIADQLREQLEQSPYDARLHYSLAELYYELEMYEQCDRILGKMNPLSPPQSDLVLLKGKLSIKRGAIEEAIAYFDSAMNLSEQEGRNGYEIWIQRGLAYQQLTRYDLALQDLTRALEWDSNNAEVMYHLGEVYRVIGQFKQSIDLLDQAIAINPSRWIYYSTRGISHYELNHYSLSLQDHIKVVEYDYSFDQAWFRKGFCHLMLMEYEDAISNLTYSLKWGGWRTAHYNIAVAQFMLGQLTEALEEVNQFMTLCPDQAIGYILAGDIYRALGEPDKALNQYAKGSRIIPQDYALHHLASRLLMGTGQESRLLEHLNHILTEYPDDPWALLEIARVYMDLGEWKTAHTFLTTYNQLTPEHLCNLYYLLYTGVALYQLKQYEAAVPYLKNAILNHVHPDASSYLSLVYYELGQMDMAVHYAQQALNLDPEHMDFKQRLTDISQLHTKKTWFGIARKKPSSHQLWPSSIPLARHQLAALPDIHFTFGEVINE